MKQIFMNYQRSISQNRKLKTDLNEKEAIQKPNRIPCKKANQRSSIYRIPSTKTVDKNKFGQKPIHHSHQDFEPPSTTQKISKSIKVDEQRINQYISQNNLNHLTCVNHQNKRAVFEEQQNRQKIYCHECAIRMVKLNIKIVTITNISLLLKNFLTEQIQKIDSQEKQVKQYLDEYYKSIRGFFDKLYYESHQTKSENYSVLFADYTVCEAKLQDMINTLNKLQYVNVIFVNKELKQNVNHQNKTKSTCLQPDVPKLCENEVQLRNQLSSNRSSIQSVTTRNKDEYVSRQRDYSFYRRKEKAPYLKI